jgi:hypothetical protein
LFVSAASTRRDEPPDTPSNGPKNFLLASPRADETAPTETAPRHSVEGFTRDELLWSRNHEDEGAVSDCCTETSILLLANRVRLTKHQIIAGRFRLARAKLLKMNMTRIQSMPHRLNPNPMRLDGNP